MSIRASHNDYGFGTNDPEAALASFRLIVRQVMLDIPPSEASFPFFTGIYDRQLQTPHERLNATGVVVTEVLVVVVVRPGDDIDAAIGTLNFLLGTVRHVEDLHSSADLDVRVSVLVTSHNHSSELHRRLNAIGGWPHRKMDVLIPSIPFTTMVEALAIVAHHASQTSHFVSLLGAGTRPTTNATATEKDVCMLFSTSLGNIASKYMNYRQGNRLAYANLFDPKSVPESYNRIDAVGGRVFHSHFVVRIASLLAYFGELSLSHVPRSLHAVPFSSQSNGMGILADSVVVDEAPALFELPDPRLVVGANCLAQNLFLLITKPI